MVAVGAVLLVLFGSLHLVAALASGDEAKGHAVSFVAWLAASVGCLVAAGLLVGGQDAAAVALGIGSMAGLIVLAVLNGYRLHGKPTWSHHLARTTAAVVVVAVVLRALAG